VSDELRREVLELYYAVQPELRWRAEWTLSHAYWERLRRIGWDQVVADERGNPISLCGLRVDLREGAQPAIGVPV
jgi:hypothetical protein